MNYITVTPTKTPSMKNGCEWTASLVTETEHSISKKEYYGTSAMQALARLSKAHDIRGIETRITQ